MPKTSLLLSLGALIQLSLVPLAQAILATGAIDVICIDGNCFETLFASQASFGIWPEMSPENNEPMVPTIPPSDDPLLCLGTTVSPSDAPNSKFVIVAPRGQCTFEQKALVAQRLGASGVIIYGNLASRYSLNETQAAGNEYTTKDIVYPSEFNDYDCNKASADIPMTSLSFSQLPYDYSVNDQLLSGSASQGNLCAAQNDDFAESCPSRRCLLTGEVSDNEQTMKACCAWDLHVWLYNDVNMTADINIPTLYITMSEADGLFQYMQTNQITDHVSKVSSFVQSFIRCYLGSWSVCSGPCCMDEC
jgi:hypothetical protein